MQGWRPGRSRCSGTDLAKPKQGWAGARLVFHASPAPLAQYTHPVVITRCEARDRRQTVSAQCAICRLTQRTERHQPRLLFMPAGQKDLPWRHGRRRLAGAELLAFRVRDSKNVPNLAVCTQQASPPRRFKTILQLQHFLDLISLRYPCFWGVSAALGASPGDPPPPQVTARDSAPALLPGTGTSGEAQRHRVWHSTHARWLDDSCTHLSDVPPRCSLRQACACSGMPSSCLPPQGLPCGVLGRRAGL